MATADWYREFGVREARGQSPTYERLSLAVAADPYLLGLLDALPEEKRQPNLLFAAGRYLGGPVGDPDAFRTWAAEHWPVLSATIRERRTQTNEPGRCAALLPVLAGLPEPLALLEVGTSAGLCLYPDRYRYRYDDRTVGPPDSPVLLECATRGPVPVPARVPEVVWRAGLDLNPLDVSRDEDLRWLDALVWPDQEHRRARLHAAASVARAQPPYLRRGDLLADLPALAALAPPGATLVVFHTSVLGYVPERTRRAFADLVGTLPGHWISNEAPHLLPWLTGADPAPDGPLATAIALDGRPVARSAPHGQVLEWLSSTGR